jgi:hypothetical protein
MSYSPVISFMMDRISGFSTSSFRLQCLGSDTATANQIVRFELPSNALVDVRKFSFAMKLAVSGTSSARLSEINNIISRVSVTVGGVELQSGFNEYALLKHIKNVLMGESACPLTGHPEFCREKSYHTGAAIADGANEAEGEYRVENWLGFLGECEPRVLDTSLLPPVQIAITLAADAAVITNSVGNDTVANFVIATGRTATDGSYTLNNMYATVPVLSFSSGIYDGMVEAMIQKNGFLEIPYKNYTMFQDVGNSVRWHASSASVDRLWQCTRSTDYNSKKLPLLVAGYNGAHGKVFDYENEKYVSSYYNMPEPEDGYKAQWLINSSLLPQYQMTALDEFTLTKQSVPRKFQDKHGLKTMRSNFSASCVRLNLEGSEQLRLASGLDSRGIAITGHYNLTTVNVTNMPCNIFVETTSVLRVGKGLQIEVLA